MAKKNFDTGVKKDTDKKKSGETKKADRHIDEPRRMPPNEVPKPEPREVPDRDYDRSSNDMVTYGD